jgi:hypothetical protein
MDQNTATTADGVVQGLTQHQRDMILGNATALGFQEAFRRLVLAPNPAGPAKPSKPGCLVYVDDARASLPDGYRWYEPGRDGTEHRLSVAVDLEEEAERFDDWPPGSSGYVIAAVLRRAAADARRRGLMSPADYLAAMEREPSC